MIMNSYILSKSIKLYTQPGCDLLYANYTSIKPIHTFQSTSVITHTKLLLISLCTFFQMIFLCIYEYTCLFVYTKKVSFLSNITAFYQFQFFILLLGSRFYHHNHKAYYITQKRKNCFGERETGEAILTFTASRISLLMIQQSLYT